MGKEEAAPLLERLPHLEGLGTFNWVGCTQAAPPAAVDRFMRSVLRMDHLTCLSLHQRCLGRETYMSQDVIGDKEMSQLASLRHLKHIRLCGYFHISRATWEAFSEKKAPLETLGLTACGEVMFRTAIQSEDPSLRFMDVGPALVALPRLRELVLLDGWYGGGSKDRGEGSIKIEEWLLFVGRETFEALEAKADLQVVLRDVYTNHFPVNWERIERSTGGGPKAYQTSLKKLQAKIKVEHPEVSPWVLTSMAEEKWRAELGEDEERPPANFRFLTLPEEHKRELTEDEKGKTPTKWAAKFERDREWALEHGYARELWSHSKQSMHFMRMQRP
jgi:hypothetical protein